MENSKIKLVCNECKSFFYVKPYRAKTRKAKYCSLKCKYKNMNYKEKTGKHHICANCGEEYYIFPSREKKNHQFCSVKCRAMASKGAFYGEKAWNWKNKDVSYGALHTWVRLHLEKPDRCTFCKKEKNLQWANKDHKYKRNLEDWIALCVKCHKKYDLTFNKKL